MVSPSSHEGGRIRDLDTRLVRTFVTVAEEGSFTRAAAKLGLTQQGASGHIQRLEMLLGCLLLERSGARVTITAQGSDLLAYCHTLLIATDSLFNATAAESPRIRIGEVRGRRMMADCWQVHRHSHPTHRASFYDLLGVEQVEAVRHGQLDVGMCRLDSPVSGLNSAPLRLDPVMVMSVRQLGPVHLKGNRLGYTGLGDRYRPWVSFCELLAARYSIELEKVEYDNTMIEAIGRGQIVGEIPPILAMKGMRDYADSDPFVFHQLEDVQPYYPWSLFWRSHESRLEVKAFVATVLRVAREREWDRVTDRDVEIWVPPGAWRTETVNRSSPS